MAFNPRRHRRRHHRHHRRHRHNPEGALSGATSLVTHPRMLLGEGAIGAAAAYMTVAVPNTFFPMAGSDIASKFLRAATRALFGGLLWGMSKRFLGQFSPAVLVGASIGAGGSFVLDLMGAQLVIGQGDTAQTGFLPTMGGSSMLSGMGFQGYGWNRAAAGLGAYARARGFNGYVRARGFGNLPTVMYGPGRAWPNRGFAGINGPGSRSMVRSSIYT